VPNQAPAHWSKDFVGHLRTVHFALIAISVGLVALILSSRSYNPSVAARELVEIEQLRGDWSFEWVGRNTLTEIMESQAVHLPCKAPRPLHLPVGHPDDVEVLGTVTTPDAKTQTLLTVKLPVSTWFTSGNEHIANTIRLDSGPELTFFPKTLSNFREWWNSLIGKNRGVLIPFSIEAQALALAPVPITMTLDRPRTPKETSQTVDMGFEQYSDDNMQGSVGSKAGFFSFRVCTLARVQIKQEHFAKVFPDWRTGDYRTSFYDLDEAAHEYGTLNFEQVSNLLAGHLIGLARSCCEKRYR